MSLGGPNGVRAYPVGEANGDSGNLITTELRYIWPGVKVFDGDLMVFGLYDWGQVEVNEKPLPTTVHNRRSISGYGVGASLGREGEFVVRGSASWPADDEVPQADTAKREPRVWVQAVKWF
jgi:hemolysin activation/secretion protein